MQQRREPGTQVVKAEGLRRKRYDVVFPLGIDEISAVKVLERFDLPLHGSSRLGRTGIQSGRVQTDGPDPIGHGKDAGVFEPFIHHGNIRHVVRLFTVDDEGDPVVSVGEFRNKL